MVTIGTFIHLCVFSVQAIALIYDLLYVHVPNQPRSILGKFKFLTFWNTVRNGLRIYYANDCFDLKIKMARRVVSFLYHTAVFILLFFAIIYDSLLVRPLKDTTYTYGAQWKFLTWWSEVRRRLGVKYTD